MNLPNGNEKLGISTRHESRHVVLVQGATREGKFEITSDFPFS